jgi:hypothetical protein
MKQASVSDSVAGTVPLPKTSSAQILPVLRPFSSGTGIDSLPIRFAMV